MIYPINLRSKVFYTPLILGSLVASVYLITIIVNFLGNFSSIFTILLSAWVIAIILGPVVSYLKKFNVSAGIAIIFSFVLLFAVLVLAGIYVLPSLYNELNVVASRLSSVDTNSLVNGLLLKFHLSKLNVNTTFGSYIASFASFILNNTVSLVGNIFALLLDLALSFFFAFYFLYEGAEWRQKLQEKIPDHFRSDFVVVSDSVTEGIQGFIKGQTIIALIVAVATVIFMKFLGLNLVVVAGLYVFISMYFPVIGPVISVIGPLLIAAAQSITSFVILFVLLFITIQLVTNVLQPKVFSKNLGLHPVLVVLSVLIGAQLFGIGGALLALPVASIIQSLLIHYYK